MKKKFILMISLVALTIILVMFSLNINKKEDDIKRNVQLIHQCMDDRYCKYDKSNLVIGNNSKELENDFYDVKFEIDNEIITMHINKLWYKNFNEELYEKEYIDWLISYIQECVDYTFSDIDKENLKQKIIEKYAKIKTLNFNIQESMGIEEMQVNFNYNSCELVVVFERRTSEK